MKFEEPSLTQEDNQYIAVHLADIVEKQLLRHTGDSRVLSRAMATQLTTYYLLQFG